MAKWRGHFGIRHQGTVNAKANTGLRPAGHRLNVNVGGALLVGVHNDFVDQAHQLIGGSSGLNEVLAFFQHLRIHGGEQGVHRASVLVWAEKLRQRLLELGVRGHSVHRVLVGGVNLHHRTGLAHGDRVQTHDHQTLCRLRQRQPALLRHEFAFGQCVQVV